MRKSLGPTAVPVQ